MRRELWITVFVGVLSAPGVGAGQEKTGTIRGVVRFTGTVPPAKLLPTGDGGMVEHRDLVVNPKTKGLRWVVAALEDAPASPKPAGDAEPVVIDQKDMLFHPRVVTVRQGQPVRFDNSDQVNHSVSIVSARKENELNVFVSAREPVTKVFVVEKAPLRVGCVLHPSMTAWVYVSPHPWAAVTDEKGAFEIGGVPPGTYTLWLRHPDTSVQERRRIEVQAGRATEVAVEWKEAKPKR